MPFDGVAGVAAVAPRTIGLRGMAWIVPGMGLVLSF
jgi:hypothetical protein